jgi:hypothetical protein
MDKTIILYDDVNVFSGICPVPYLFFEKENIENGSVWASKYSITIEGQITGTQGPASRLDLENKQNKLIESFISDFKTLKVKEDANEYLINNCYIDSISFGESKYYALLPFTISISAYDDASFKENSFVIEPSDSWEFSEGDDGTVTLSHSVSAIGINKKNSSIIDLAIKNAKEWVYSRTGLSKKIESLRIKNLQISDFVLDSISESIDRFSGKYSLIEKYKGDLMSLNSTGAGILRYATEVSKNVENGITNVEINGSVVGKKAFSSPESSIGEVNIQDLRDKLNSIEFFQVAASAAKDSTGSEKINDIPFAKTITENKNDSKIDFSFTFDDDPVPPGVAKCVYSVALVENAIKNIVDMSIDAEILCERGDLSVRWAAVKQYFDEDFNPYSFSVGEYKRAGYTKNIQDYPKTESIKFDEFNARINYSASWTDKYMPYQDLLSFISERVELKPSINIYAVQPSLYVAGKHNVQSFSTAQRAEVSINIEAIGKPNTSLIQVKDCVDKEVGRLKSLYVGSSKNVILDQVSENYTESLRKFSISTSYSFDGNIVGGTV